jgi:hypothetical protein
MDETIRYFYRPNFENYIERAASLCLLVALSCPCCKTKSCPVYPAAALFSHGIGVVQLQCSEFGCYGHLATLPAAWGRVAELLRHYFRLLAPGAIPACRLAEHEFGTNR